MRGLQNTKMPKCVYCGKEYDVPKGVTVFLNDGTIHNFCSSKCRKNMLMKRRKVRWISKKKKTKQAFSEPENKEDKTASNKEK